MTCKKRPQGHRIVLVMRRILIYKQFIQEPCVPWAKQKQIQPNCKCSSTLFAMCHDVAQKKTWAFEAEQYHIKNDAWNCSINASAHPSPDMSENECIVSAIPTIHLQFILSTLSVEIENVEKQIRLLRSRFCSTNSCGCCAMKNV